MKFKIGISIIIAATIATIFIRLQNIPDPLPNDLIGIWHSDSPGYQDRYFEISDAIMVFGQGNRRLNIQFVSRIKEKKVKGGLRQYTIHHQDNYGFEQKTVIFFNRADVNTIWFGNQENVVWKKFTLS